MTFYNENDPRAAACVRHHQAALDRAEAAENKLARLERELEAAPLLQERIGELEREVAAQELVIGKIGNISAEPSGDPKEDLAEIFKIMDTEETSVGTLDTILKRLRDAKARAEAAEAKCERVGEAFKVAEESGATITDDVLLNAIKNGEIASLCVVRADAWFAIRTALDATEGK